MLGRAQGAGFDVVNGFLEFVDVAGDYDNVGAFGSEESRDAEAHALGSAGDENGLYLLVFAFIWCTGRGAYPPIDRELIGTFEEAHSICYQNGNKDTEKCRGPKNAQRHLVYGTAGQTPRNLGAMIKLSPSSYLALKSNL